MLRRQDNFEQLFADDLVRDCHLIVGFSGGADSVSLLHFLWQHQKELCCTVEAVHLNHCLRGEESERDEAFVRDFCMDRKIPLTVRQLDIAVLAEEQGLSEETCGREMRYALFDEIAAAGKDTAEVRIVTAHTLSDDLETVLFRLARGTGLDGLCGIPARRGNIVRPLLRCTREMVEAYCEREHLSFVTDSSNSDTGYARNRIRTEVIPALKKINSAAEENFSRQKEMLTEEQDFLVQETRRTLHQSVREDGYDVKALQKVHPALRHRVAAVLLREQEIPVDRNGVQALSLLIEKGTGSAELRPGKVFAVRRGILRAEQDLTAEVLPVIIGKDYLSDGAVHPVTVKQIFSSENEQLQQEKTVWLQVISAEDQNKMQKVYENLLIFALDYDTISGSLVFRSRQAGDRLAQSSRGERILKKLYSEAGLTALARQTRLVLADELSVIWAEGFEPDRRVVVCEDTERVLLMFGGPPEK